jgi:hypothetical protein
MGVHTLECCQANEYLAGAREIIEHGDGSVALQKHPAIWAIVWYIVD